MVFGQVLSTNPCYQRGSRYLGPWICCSWTRAVRDGHYPENILQHSRALPLPVHVVTLSEHRSSSPILPPLCHSSFVSCGLVLLSHIVFWPLRNVCTVALEIVGPDHILLLNRDKLHRLAIVSGRSHQGLCYGNRRQSNHLIRGCIDGDWYQR